MFSGLKRSGSNLKNITGCHFSLLAKVISRSAVRVFTWQRIGLRMRQQFGLTYKFCNKTLSKWNKTSICLKITSPSRLGYMGQPLEQILKM